MSVTFKDVAKELGVSASTISKAINDRPGVSEDLRKRILQALDEKNLRPKQRIGGLVKEAGVSITLLVRINQSVKTDPFYALITEAISAELQNHRCSPLYNVMHERRLEPEAFHEMFESGSISGAIMVGADFDVELLEQVARLGVPVVTVDNQYDGFGSVNTDNCAGAMDATRHLIELGHRNIIFLSGPLDHKSIQQRYKGYLDGLSEGRGGSPIFIECEGVSVDDGYDAIRSCSHGDFTAVFAANDKLAIGAIKALKEKGKRIPEDISVVGFDDIEWALHTEPPLTTVRTAKHQLGALAAQLLMHQMNGNEEFHAVNITVAAKLITRGSTAPVKIRKN
ncbi:LacI family DNA-binding transcriptional regulator [Cohnella hongkongensis]|uniref:LacI family DNA-binding transcriptional regulator n=1 Tax=Cohnella hongkongensis TaxID=178337 RepID=A0ABV9FK35_9BACL